MPPPKSKSKQVLEYLYRYTIEKGSYEVIEAAIPYGKIGMILLEVGYHIYEIISNANEEDRLAILNEIQQASPQEIERLSDELSNDPNVIYPIELSEDERKVVARGIYKTLRQMPKQKTNPQQILQSINQGLFGGKNVLSVQNINASHSQSMGSAVVKTLVNGSELKFGFNQRQKLMFLAQYPVINGFEIKGILGEGAYARVYLANQQLGNGKWRTCALKVGVLESEDRFKREVQNMQLVNHPNVLSCWNTGRFQEQGVNKYWISMPNMGGLTLEHLIIANSLDLETKLLILMQIADGLEALHQKKIVHRDLKPSNCLISSNFELKISDFGLSKDLNNKIDSSHSKNAYAIGTPAYMSPENINGTIGYYSDVWAFGVIAFELLSGNLPWGRDINPLVLIGNIQHKDINARKQLASLKLPSEFTDIIHKCLKRDFTQRYRDGIELKGHFYRVAKEERKRLRHNRFRESWLLLIEKKLIETFMLNQVENGFAEFPLEAFLTMPEVATLPLALDHERLGEVLNILSRVSREIALGEALRNQNRLEMDKNVEIESIDCEIAERLKTLPPDQIFQMLDKLLEERDLKKAIVHQNLMAINQKRIINEKIAVILNRLKIEIRKESKDFDQVMADLSEEEIENKEKKRVWSRMMIVGGLILSIVGGLWVWSGILKDRKKTVRLEQDETQRQQAIIEQTTQRQQAIIEQKKEKAKHLAKKQQDKAEQLAKLKAERLAKEETENLAKEQQDKADLLAKEQQDKVQKINHLREDLLFILIKGGSFMMGSESGEQNEKPIHRVSIKNFYMSKTEITVEQYRKCVDAGVCSEPHWDDGSCYILDGSSWKKGILGKEFRNENQPVVCIDWKQAREFAKWVGGDLPSEAQWEYASRLGGKDIQYPWGNTEPTCDIANFNYTNFNYKCHGVTTPVCSKAVFKNVQGLCDMGGNVWEWVLDEWHDSYVGAPSNGIGWCSDRECDSNNSASRVGRGGSWNDEASNLRSTYRSDASPSACNSHLGFRVAHTSPLN